MELKEAYIDNIVCHHYSQDSSRCLINNSCISLEDMDAEVLKDFFIKPFAAQKSEFSFAHPVSLAYNIVYQLSLKLLDNEDFINCSQDMFRHLQSVSSQPTIKDGDVFVAKIGDIVMDGSYYEGLGIYKIESKSEFIETSVDSKGIMTFSVKSGFSYNKIDKACLIVFTSQSPVCYLIDRSKDTKFWRQDFLGLVPQLNSYSQSKSAMQVLRMFIEDELPLVSKVTKSEQVDLINRCSEYLKGTEVLNMEKAALALFQDENVASQFEEYQKVFEERENIHFQDSFDVDKKAVTVLKSTRRIRLDDTAEIHLMKTGNFLERGFDDDKGMYYYKLYFSKEK